MSIATDKPRFRVPLRMVISGASNTGKTRFCIDLLKNQSELIDPPFKKLIYCYSTYQKIYDELKSVAPCVEFHKGVPTFLAEEEQVHENTCVVLDDQLTAFKNEDPFLIDMFIRFRHLNISVIMLTQQLFYKGYVTVRRNANYLVLFPNMASQSMIQSLSYQLFPEHKNYIYDAFKQATAVPFIPLIVDLNPDTDKNLRVLSGILPDQPTCAYLPLK